MQFGCGVWGLAEAAGGEQPLAGEPGGIVRGQEDGYGSDVAGLADASERSLYDSALLKFRANEAGGVRAFGFDHSRVDAVDADLPGSEFAGEDAGDGVNRAFGGGVYRASGRSAVAREGADINIGSLASRST